MATSATAAGEVEEGERGAALAQGAAVSRMAWIDNLRIFVILFVLSIHMGNPYADRGWWYFMQPADQPISVLVARCIMLGPSFTMTALLCISGYLLPASYDRRGPRGFLWEKVVRLGIPLLIGALLVFPLLQYFTFHLHYGYRGYDHFWDYYRNAWMGMGPRPADWNGPGWPDRNLAHLWYIEHLLVYCFIYAGYRLMFAPGKARSEPGWMPGHGSIVLFMLACGLATFAVRSVYGYNTVIALGGILQIDVTHYPIWIPWFFVGLAAWRYQWLTRFPARIGWFWLKVALGIAFFNTFIANFPPFEKYLVSLQAHSAGATWPVFCKSMWETIWAVSFTVGLFVLFRDKLNVQTRLLAIMSASAYAVYVFHSPVTVALQFAMEDWPLWPFFKYVFGTVASIVITFALAWFVILRLPYARRVF